MLPLQKAAKLLNIPLLQPGIARHCKRAKYNVILSMIKRGELL